MELAVKQLYAEPGPFATVYLDASRDTESGAHEIELRWRALAESLRAQDTDADDLAALEEEVTGHRGAGRHGLVLVASGGAVRFEAELPSPPAQDEARCAPLPHLMPFFAERGVWIDHLAVVVDRTGADLHLSLAYSPERSSTVEGTGWHTVHRTGRDDWSEWHFQRRVEAAWEHNTREVAQVVRDLAVRHRLPVVLLAGDPQARRLLAGQLDTVLSPVTDVVDVEHGQRGAASSGAQENAVREGLLGVARRDRRALLERLRQNLARHEYAVQGAGAVLDLVRTGAVDTVVVTGSIDPGREAFFGPEPGQLAMTEDEIAALGVQSPQQDRLDSVLVRGLAATDARLVVTPGEHDAVQDGIAALLRY